MKNKASALVIGDLSLVRALGMMGIPVALATTEPRSSTTLSRYCSEVVPTPSAVSDPHELVSTVIEWARLQPVPPVIFCQGDHDLLAFSRERRRVAPYARVPLPDAELVEDLVDKVRFAALARRHSLPVPVTTTLARDSFGSRELAARPEGKELREWSLFPCVVKPSMRTNWLGSALQVEGVGSRQKAMRVETRAELDRVAPLMAAHETDVILQAAIEGGEERVVSYHAYVREGGEVVAEFTGKKVRTSPQRYGFSTCVEITDDADVKRLGRSICETLGFSGVLKIDFKRDERDERLYLMEINPRFNLWHHPGTIAGISIPALVYADCTNPGSARATHKVKPGVRWMSGRGDLLAMREYRANGDLSMAGWLRDVATVDVNEDFLLRDPLPALADLALGAERRVRRLIGRVTPKAAVASPTTRSNNKAG
ncbi:MAG: ATP-grasp domain-containing protein [Deltaproteobacteria bacterium]|nr:ATP-grasp domain-containing protein [Deltaproteobacteria bacterium]